MNPIIEDLYQKVRSAEIAVSLARRNLNDLSKPIVHQALLDMRKSHVCKPDPEDDDHCECRYDLPIPEDPKDLSLGWEWECEKSPTAHCVYNRQEDPCQDHCLFCGEPDERK